MLLKIRELAGRRATDGMAMSSDPLVRKLEPGEVVDVPENIKIDMDGEEFLLHEAMYATEKVEIAPGQPTRPFKFKNKNESRMTSPAFYPKNPAERKQMEKIRARIKEELEPALKVKPPKVKRPANEELYVS